MMAANRPEVRTGLRSKPTFIFSTLEGSCPASRRTASITAVPKVCSAQPILFPTRSPSSVIPDSLRLMIELKGSCAMAMTDCPRISRTATLDISFS